MLLSEESIQRVSNNYFFGIYGEKNSSYTDSTGYIFEDVNFYYKPTETPLYATLFFFIRLTFFTIAEIINIKVFLVTNREKCLVQDVAKVFALTQIIFCPIWLVYQTSTDFVYPVNEVVGQWFCTFGWFFIHLGGIIIAFHSFVVALMRYFFIIHQTKVERYGKKKARNIFLWISVIIPLILVLWGAINGSDIDVISIVNKCNGKSVKVFLIESSASEVFKSRFCEYDGEDWLWFGNLMSKTFNKFRRVSCIAHTTVSVIMTLNLTEGIFYFIILSDINR